MKMTTMMMMKREMDRIRQVLARLGCSLCVLVFNSFCPTFSGRGGSWEFTVGMGDVGGS